MDRATIISLAAYGVIASGLGLALTMALRIWQHRSRKPQPTLTVRLTADTSKLLEAFDVFRREQALHNDVVRLWRGCYDVQAEAEQVLERYQEQLERKKYEHNN